MTHMRPDFWFTQFHDKFLWVFECGNGIRHDSKMNHEVAAYFKNVLKFLQNRTNIILLKENKLVF